MRENERPGNGVSGGARKKRNYGAWDEDEKESAVMKGSRYNKEKKKTVTRALLDATQTDTRTLLRERHMRELLLVSSLEEAS